MGVSELPDPRSSRNARTSCHGATRIMPDSVSYVGFSLPEPDDARSTSLSFVRSVYDGKP